MKTDVKSLTAMSVASLALMALMMVPGLLMQPTIVQAQEPNRICSSGGVTGCITCPGYINKGCDGTTTPPGGWRVGNCVDNPRTGCTSDTMDCGDWIDCMTKLKTGNACTIFTICI